MKKLVLAVVTVAAVIAAALIPSGPPVEAATPGFASAISSVKYLSWQTNASVNALATTGNTVYAGGLFTRIRPPGKGPGQSEAPRAFIAAFNRTNGAPLAWAPKLNGSVWSIATSADGKSVVIGGDFTTVNGVPRNRIAKFNVATGALDPTFKPSVAYRVKALAIYGDTVYMGGSFGKVNNVVRNRLAAVRVSNGALLAWNPNADDDVYAIDVADNGTRVFVGGPFKKVGGQSHYSLAMVNTTTGGLYAMPAAAAIPPPTAACTSRVKDIDTLGGKVFVSNGGDGRGCYDGVLAADASTGKLLWQNKCLGATEAIKAIGEWVYKGSHAHDCSSAGSFPEGTGSHYLLVEYASNGKIGPWFPNTDAGGTTKVGPLAFASGGNDLWVGGDFLKVNGKVQAGLAKFANIPGGASPAVPKGPSANTAVAKQVTVTFTDTYDLDNSLLTYNIFRGTTNISSRKLDTFYWQTRKTISFVDTGVKSGQKVGYHIEVHDGRNIMRSPVTTVTVK